MNCDKARQLWHDRFDGDPAPTEEIALAEHLASCAGCRDYHRQMDEMTSALDLLKDASESVGLENETSAAPTSAEPRPRVLRFAHWRITRAAAAIALLIAGGVYFQAFKSVPNETAGLPSHTPSITPADPGEFVPARIALSDHSAAKFIPVAQRTSQPNVHVFVLYQTVKDPNDNMGMQ